MKSFRIYHLAFAAGVAVAYFTAEELGIVHAWMGYVIAGLLALRLILAVVGKSGFALSRLIPRLIPRPARAGPQQAKSRKAAIGNALTLALLLSIAGTAATGIAMDSGGTLVGKSIRADDEKRDGGNEHDDEEGAFGLSLITRAYADDGGEHDGERGEESLLGELHETSGNLILPLAALHIIYLLLFRWPLARFVAFIPRRAA